MFHAISMVQAHDKISIDKIDMDECVYGKSTQLIGQIIEYMVKRIGNTFNGNKERLMHRKHSTFC